MNRAKIIYRIMLSWVPLLLLGACVDELEIESLGNDEETPPLVIEAVLTDEVINQKVYLSRSSQRLDLETDTIYNPNVPLGRGPRDSVDAESGATVRLSAMMERNMLFLKVKLACTSPTKLLRCNWGPIIP